jgi:two-component system copper resistance phosphate regulon response regulator CusR
VRILIAEDDPLVFSFIEKRLRTAGYTTQVADDGDKAIEFALRGDFDLVLLDMALPRRDGFEVLQELRRGGSQIPVIVVTGRPEMRQLVAGLGVGSADFMVKPFRFEELLARVRAHLRFHGMRPAGDVEIATHDEEGSPLSIDAPSENGRRDPG